MYLSVNARDNTKVYKELLHFLIDNPDFNLAHIQSKIAGMAAKKECALEKKWMFDFDCEDENELDEFLDDLSTAYSRNNRLHGFLLDSSITYILDFKRVYKTPNGYAIVIDYGFDTRELLEKYKDIVTLKRDDLLCVAWDWTYLEG